MEHFSLDDLGILFYRRKRVFRLTAAIVLAVMLLFSANWSRYRAIATIEIEQPIIPTSIASMGSNDGVSATILADRRIRAIEQRVTSTESLNAIIKQLNLYPGSENLSPQRLADKMRKHIALNFTASSIANPIAAQKESIEQLSANAFSLRFDYNDANLTKQALDALVERFIAEEAQQRRAQSAETLNFIDEETKALEKTIHEQEAQIAQFRATYGESGPTATMLNQQANASNAVNLQNVENSLAANEATVATLRSQLASTDPYLTTLSKGELIASPNSQLKTLKAQLASISGRYGPDHPDVLKLRTQIAALKAAPAAGKATAADADNPAYVQLSGQLNAALAQKKSLQAQRASLKAQQDKYTTTLATNPKIEQQMAQLTLDLDNAKERYRTLKDKRLAAEMRLKLESSNTSARLRLISESALPEHTSPSRTIIALLGIFLAAVSGTLAVLVAEWLHPTIRSPNQLTALVGVAPLITLPMMRRKP